MVSGEGVLQHHIAQRPRHTRQHTALGFFFGREARPGHPVMHLATDQLTDAGAASARSARAGPFQAALLQRVEQALRFPCVKAAAIGCNAAVEKRDVNANPYWRDCVDGELTFQIDGLQSPEGGAPERVRGRTGLLEKFDAARKAADERLARDVDSFQNKALALLTSGRARDALNIRAEDGRLRDRYGRHLFGQSCLMARRLVEAGARYVTVHYDCVDGYSWDSHRNTADVHKHLLPTFDQGASALITDLEARGLLDDTLVVALGEMGRTPKANGEWGRDHWSFLFPGLFAGGGVARGGLLGSSNKDASHAVDLPCSPEDLAATLYHALGMDPELRLTDHQGREVSAIDNGRVIRELFA